MKKRTTLFTRVLTLLMLACLFTGSILASAKEEDAGTVGEISTAEPEGEKPEEESSVFEPFFRIDRDDADAWQGELDNVRFIKEGLYKFGKTSAKYGIDDIVPDEDGLDNLCISGSAQFSLPQFFKLANELREVADGKKIYIIDLRRESHVLLGAIPVSWYESHNWGNLGLSLTQIEASENFRFRSLAGRKIFAYAREDDHKRDETELFFSGVLTEKELVENAGFQYYRLPVQDHTWPKPEQIDDFIDFVKSIDMDNTWLHFHCQAGKGRTGIMMTIYDKMKNPQVSMMDVVVRQTKLGGSYPLYTEDSDNYKVPYYAEKAKMIPLFCQYVEENYESDYEVKWSEWLATYEENEAAEE